MFLYACVTIVPFELQNLSNRLLSHVMSLSASSIWECVGVELRISLFIVLRVFQEGSVQWNSSWWLVVWVHEVHGMLSYMTIGIT